MNKNKYMRAIDHLVTNICSEDEIVSLLKCIEDYFGYDWLKEKENINYRYYGNEGIPCLPMNFSP